ncbi:MAG: DUF1289 domain-containing protein [Fimbriimonadaceae bacterium]
MHQDKDYASPDSDHEQDDEIKSPCTKVCRLDENDVCEGCQRTIDEIIAWPSLNNQKKSGIINRLLSKQQATGTH